MLAGIRCQRIAGHADDSRVLDCATGDAVPCDPVQVFTHVVENISYHAEFIGEAVHSIGQPLDRFGTFRFGGRSTWGSLLRHDEIRRNASVTRFEAIVKHGLSITDRLVNVSPHSSIVVPVNPRADGITTTLVAECRGFGHAEFMAYGLSFGSDFFWNEKRDAVLPHVHRKQPTSVEQAVLQLSEEMWSRLAREVFDCEPECLSMEAVLQKIEETNTCLNLDPPVEVCIDPDGEFTVLVFDLASA